MTAEVGASAELDHVVTERDTALAVGSGDVEVLGTPRVVAWCEAATVAAVAPSLDEGDTTVGTQVELDHVRATPVGGSVRTQAVLVDVAGRQLTFEVTATDEHGEIARGRVLRVVVDRRRFVERFASPSG